MLSIPEWFERKNIFITGGLGFIGKVTIEKILRSIPNVGHIFVLIRTKKNQSASQRLEKFKTNNIFDLLREKNPKALNKLRAIEGDLEQLEMGVKPSDREFLKENVNVILHVAASVRFDDHLTDAIFTNVRSIREVCRFALEVPKLDILVHVSTSYCNCDKRVSKEEIYPAYTKWKDTIKLAEETDRQLLDVLTLQYISPFPNTYTFTKSLAEHVVKDLCEGKIRTLIARPSIIISTLDEPVQGWIDNVNGPVGLMIGAGKGILKIALANENATADFMPVDILVKALIVATWTTGHHSPCVEKKTQVCNLNNNRLISITNQELMEIGLAAHETVPLENIISFPRTQYTLNKYVFYWVYYIYQLIPALFFDGILKLLGKKTLLVKVQKRILIAFMSLAYFTLNEFDFDNKKFVKMEDNILDCDKKTFGYLYMLNRSIPDYYYNCILGSKKYLLKEPLKNIPKAKIHLERLRKLDIASQWLQYIVIILLAYQLNLFNYLQNKLL